MVEFDSGYLDRRVGRVEEVDGGREEEDCGCEEETAAEDVVWRSMVVGENDDVLGIGVRVGR